MPPKPVANGSTTSAQQATKNTEQRSNNKRKNKTKTNAKSVSAAQPQTNNMTTSAESAPKPPPTPLPTDEIVLPYNMTAHQVESLFLHLLSESTKLAHNNETMNHNIGMAKMLHQCIRMLHSCGWRPATVVRAMVHLEVAAGTERSVKGLMFRSKREKVTEAGEKRAALEAEAEVEYGDEEGEVCEAALVDVGGGQKVIASLVSTVVGTGSGAGSDEARVINSVAGDEGDSLIGHVEKDLVDSVKEEVCEGDKVTVKVE